MVSVRDKWVIFDADNTLWDIEHLYDEARNEMCEFIKNKGFENREIEEYQRKRDSELYSIYGYSSCRFARSFEDTAVHILKGKCKNQDIIHVRKIALDVFEKDPRYNKDIEEIFNIIKDRKYKIGLITAGELWVQERRISNFDFTNEINEIEVVEIKTKETICDFMDKYSVDRDNSWMIGDSFNSDVKPAIDCGLNVIWYKNINWHEIENHGSSENIYGNYHEIYNLKDMLGVIE